MITSPGIFLNFLKILIIRVVSGAKEQTMTQEWQNIMSLTLQLRNHVSYDCDF